MISDIITVEALADALKNKVEEIVKKEEIKVCFDGNKIILYVDKDGVKSKIVVPVEVKKRPSRLEPELVEKIRRVREILKGKRDSIYLFTLLMSLHSELGKVSVIKLDEESRKVLVPAMGLVEKDLVKSLEVK